jgi:hypothetical protein
MELPKEVTVKKRAIVKLPVVIDVNPKKKTCSIEYGEVAPIVLKDGTKVFFQFDQGSTTFEAAK